MLTVIDGDRMSADEAAWAMLAGAAERALVLPGLSRETTREMAEIVQSSRRCARLPPLRLTHRPAVGNYKPKEPA